MAGLYVHIPFCKQACYYCDFHFSTDQSQRSELVRAMAHEIAIQRSYIKDPIDTIYFGGGTPSILAEQELDLLINAAQKNLDVRKGIEVTLECNPDDISPDRLKSWRDQGINRLSVGIQSFDDKILKFLNRAHNSSTAKKTLDQARAAGFNNISIDLIYAIPDLTDDKWESVIHEALDFKPEHISSYSLTIEERTVFGNWSKHGKLHPVSDDVAARQFEILMDVLDSRGYEHYEISNFSRPGFNSQHNSSYWKGVPYLGVGPGAHSFDGSSRQFNVRNNAVYVRSLNKGELPCEKEVLTRENRINEYIMTSLRTSWGCDLNYLKTTLDDDIIARCSKYLAFLQVEQLATIDGGLLKLARKGKLLADKIAEDLMLQIA
ncbi:MAG TPA: radical SAM family heme chaperone HemW [Cyclobacteriaceae bacterium]|nr:radical SAM family heme chaperone HemW [Cyclobacteriaceae bacterium]